MLKKQNDNADSLIYPKELAGALQRSLRWAQKVFVNVLYTLDLDKMKRLCDEYEEARFLLTLFQGLDNTSGQQRMDELAHDDTQTRLDLFRLSHPKELLQHLPNRGVLASYLGMDPSTLSKLDWPPLDELAKKYNR